MWKSLPIKFGHVLLLYGGWGLLGMSFLDSSVLPFPVVNDLALMVMASHRPAWWPLYALATTLDLWAASTYSTEWRGAGENCCSGRPRLTPLPEPNVGSGATLFLQCWWLPCCLHPRP